VAGGDLGTGTVARSQDNGASWAIIAAGPFTGIAAGPFAVVTNIQVAFSDAYGSNSTILTTATDTDADAGVWSYNYSAGTPAWSRIDSATTVANGTGLKGAPADTAVANAGMVYAADLTAGAGAARIRQPRTVAEPLADAGSAFMGLWYEAGSNVLYSIDTAAQRIRTYTDTLNVSGTGVVVSAIAGGTATVSWNDLPNAGAYRVIVNTANTQTNFYTAANTGGVGVVVNNAANTAAITGLVTNTTYFVSVWGATPVSSYLFDAATAPTSFTTLPGAPVAPPVNLLPINGAINIPVMGPAFAWAAPTGGAISYDWQLSNNPLFLSLVDEVNVTVPYLVWDGPLEYEAAYYWRVRSVTGAGTSGWITSVFTTVEEQEDLVVPPPPTPVITIEIPDFEIPDFEIPDIIIPDFEIEIPEIVIPDIVIPDFEIEIPEIVIPDIVIPDFEIVIPDIVIPDIVIPPLEQPDVIVNLPAPIVTTVTSTIEAPPTPAYVWAIVGIGAILSIAVIILIVRTRRIV
jgi:hypothetical protein